MLIFTVNCVVALASRCLQLVVHYIPIIRAHFETKLQPKQFSVLRHFDHITKVTLSMTTLSVASSWLNKSLREEFKIKCHDKISKDFSSMWVVLLRLFVVLQDYNDHIAEISAKLVAIMDSLFEKVLSKVRWGQGTREHFMNGFKFYASIKIILFTEDFQL